ncbi:MAG: twin-arginine translocase subunit TatC [Candidatus Omnitrophica bacterium]|nr:twin-arginine translocase subunit TatC [Candidatus Omnitrophota bacterium]
MTRKSEQPQLSFVEHLGELRIRLMISIAAVAAGGCLAYFFSEKILQVLLQPIQTTGSPVYFLSPADAFIMRIKIALFAGAIGVSPIVISQIWLFVAPGLHDREKRMIFPWIAATSLLFLGGISFCFFGVIPVALKFLMGFQTDFLKPMISVTSYVDFLWNLSLAFGIAFNLPIVVIILSSLGIVTTKTLAHYRKHAIVLIFILAAIITPTPDMATQTLLAVPLIFLYELGILGARVMGWRKREVC